MMVYYLRFFFLTILVITSADGECQGKFDDIQDNISVIYILLVYRNLLLTRIPYIYYYIVFMCYFVEGIEGHWKCDDAGSDYKLIKSIQPDPGFEEKQVIYNSILLQ